MMKAKSNTSGRNFLRVVLVKLARFVRKPIFIQAWIVPVWFLLGFAKLAILTVSFRRLHPLLGAAVGAVPWVPLVSEEGEQRARQIGDVVRLAARFTFWDSNCFPQVLVARLLMALYRLPYGLFFGVRRGPDSGELQAHAWMACGPVKVSGGASFSRYTVVGVFVSPSLVRGGCGIVESSSPR